MQSKMFLTKVFCGFRESNMTTLLELSVLYDFHQLSGLVVRVSITRLGGWGSVPARVKPKTIKIVPDAFLFGVQHQGLDWG